MSEQNLGLGLYLDENLDFSVDTTGDIRATDSGLEELEKDLAFQMIISLSQYLGQTPNAETEAEIKRTAYLVAAGDVRVSDVARNDITVGWNHNSREMEVTVPVTTIIDEEYELVFDV